MIQDREFFEKINSNKIHCHSRFVWMREIAFLFSFKSTSLEKSKPSFFECLYNNSVLEFNNNYKEKTSKILQRKYYES